MKKILGTMFLLWCTTAGAEINKIYYLGDSLSDNGNLYNTLLKIIPKSPPYYNGRFSNGPVWSDVTENFYLSKYNIVSSNYAVGGSTVLSHHIWDGFLPYYLSTEVNHYCKQITGESDCTGKKTTKEEMEKSLYFIWTGANDYDTDKPSSTSDVTAEILNQLNIIYKGGGRHFVVMGLPDLSKTPFAKTVNYADKLRESSLTHNAKLQNAVETYQANHPDARVVFFNISDVLDDILSNPEKYNKKYNTHFKNTTDSCWNGGYTLKNNRQEVDALKAELDKAIAERRLTLKAKTDTRKLAQQILNTPSLAEVYRVQTAYAQGAVPCDRPDEYVFWDHVHPTTSIHNIMAQLVIERLNEDRIIP